VNTPFKIYCILHNVTDRAYIGRSRKVEKRLKDHLFALRSHKHVVEDMQADFDKYGEDYTITILEENVDFKDRNKEHQWMEKYQSNIRGKGYNYKDPKWNHPHRAPKYMLSFENRILSIGDWASQVNIPYEVIYSRVNLLGWSAEKALTTPIGKRGGCHAKNELELINIIRGGDEPLQALRMASEIFLDYIRQCDQEE
jgi:hypothetical protein